MSDTRTELMQWVRYLPTSGFLKVRITWYRLRDWYGRPLPADQDGFNLIHFEKIGVDSKEIVALAISEATSRPCTLAECEIRHSNGEWISYIAGQGVWDSTDEIVLAGGNDDGT